SRLKDNGGYQYTLMLAADSEAVDGGIVNGNDSFDQRGYQYIAVGGNDYDRIGAGSSRDIGAVERGGYIGYYLVNGGTQKNYFSSFEILEPVWNTETGVKPENSNGFVYTNDKVLNSYFYKSDYIVLAKVDIYLNSTRILTERTYDIQTSFLIGNSGASVWDQHDIDISFYGARDGGTVISGGLDHALFTYSGSVKYEGSLLVSRDPDQMNELGVPAISYSGDMSISGGNISFDRLTLRDSLGSAVSADRSTLFEYIKSADFKNGIFENPKYYYTDGVGGGELSFNEVTITNSMALGGTTKHNTYLVGERIVGADFHFEIGYNEKFDEFGNPIKREDVFYIKSVDERKNDVYTYRVAFLDSTVSYETGVMEVNDDGGAVSDYKFARYDSGNGMSLTTIPEDELGSYKIIVNNSALYGNFAKGMGGAIAASAGAEINSSTLAYNIAGAGGALALDFNVNGSTIAYNVALGHYQEFYSREGDNKIVLEYSGVIDGGAAFGVEMEFDSEGERH
ncbi:MAG: choice-of-anchor Q domain-containing protein, partial [Victivallaceae bacterium]